MASRTAATIWDWTLVVLPFTVLITFLVMIITCNLVSHSGGSLRPISELASDSAYVYFIAGFALLFPQIIAIIIGRLQLLLRTQNLINKILLYIAHGVTLIPFVFMVIVALVKGGSRSDAHLLAVYGLFGFIGLYCLLHTIAVFYLYFRKASDAYYTKIYLATWFLVCSLLFLASVGVWSGTNGTVLGYITAAAPFLYFLGFVPQFWDCARSRKRYSAVSRVAKAFDSLNG